MMRCFKAEQRNDRKKMNIPVLYQELLSWIVASNVLIVVCITWNEWCSFGFFFA